MLVLLVNRRLNEVNELLKGRDRPGFKPERKAHFMLRFAAMRLEVFPFHFLNNDNKG